NRHNRFYITVEPLPQEVIDLLKSDEISMRMPELERREKLMAAGLDKEDARNVVGISGGNLFTDLTKGVQYLGETMELILEGFEEAMTRGPLAEERCEGIHAKLVDVKLHEDSVHRGPAQVIPAVRQALYAAILSANPTLIEPMQEVFINTPQAMMGSATRVIQGRRGQILDISSEGDLTMIKAKAPVAELFGFAGDIRSATEGRALWSTEFAGFERVPQNLVPEIIRAIRQRKGLKPEPPKASDYLPR
ncbi:MAG TPA: elongation factor EF-2, partial [Candidatus Syntrophoarchaeum butanivorans]|nr:elongation factor EF-2 [Candidatus Syntrophoarchaeum butanivorans]